MQQGTEPRASLEQIGLMMLKVWGYKQGEVVSIMIHLGDRLGLYKAMSGAGRITPEDLAKRTSLHERWVREWLRGQAAAGLVESEDGEVFELTPAGGEVLANEESSLYFAAGAFGQLLPPDVADDIADAFRTGVGLPYDRHGRAAVHRTERSFGPWTRLAFVPRIIPALDGVQEKLERGADVVDVGCGAGLALIAMAKAFPRSRFHGYDLSTLAIERARENVAEAGVTNVTLHEARAEDLPTEPSFDFVVTFDCIHDMTQPGEAIRAIRRAIRDDGTWLIKDIRSTGSFAQDRANPMLAMMYGFSVIACMSSGLSEPGGAGLGTLGFNSDTARRMCADAGFSSFTVHDFDDPANLYYEVQP